MSTPNPKSVSNEATPPSADRRRGERQVTILRIGKLVNDGGQQLCLIRNISSGGLMAHVYATHAEGDRIEIELKSDDRLAGEVLWARDGHIGVRFDGAVEVSDILTHRAGADGRKSRPPRLEVCGRARIRVDGASHRAEIRDISQGGVKVEIDDQIDLHADVIIHIEGLEPIRCIVRWCRDGMAGLAFMRPIPFDTLTKWLETRCV